MKFPQGRFGRLPARTANLVAFISLFISTFVFPGDQVYASSSIVPEMRWVLLPAGSTGSCVSNTDGCTNTFCYGLEYTPEHTGTLTSYTTAFFAECINNASPAVSNVSCVMTNNSNIVNGCVDYGLIQLQCSGNQGGFAVTSGVPVIIHQVCFNVPPGVTITVIEDVITDLTTSIDLPGGLFETEYPSYQSTSISHSNYVTNANDDGPGSLRYMVGCAANGSTITFLSSLTNQAIVLTSGVIGINKDLTIKGLGQTALEVSGNNSSVIFHVSPGKTLTLKDIALKNASAMSNGGAIYAEGNVTFQNVLLQNNFENGIPKSMTLANTAVLQILGPVNFKF